MTFFESLLVLLLIAGILLQVARRLSLPYPAMLACAGVLVAFLPGSPEIGIEPQTALALFIAPIIVDAAYDFPPATALRILGPLLTLAVLGVITTTAAVAVLAYELLHLPVAAAIALGAIVAPPDAAAASAVLSAVPVPRRIEELLKAESLFNDATSLLLFGGALAVQAHGQLHLGSGARLVSAIPGGILLGIALAYLFRWLNSFARDTLGGNLLQFVGTYFVWIVAEHLQLSAVLCTIAFAMTLASAPEQRSFPRMRVQSFAVWSAVVFTLNVLAFLIMGMQSRVLLSHMQGTELRTALRFAALIVLTVILIRLFIVMASNQASAWISRRNRKLQRTPLREAFFVGWSGMRGFVTLATAFALPASFPQRDTLVLTAFAVVLGTLVLQGLTLQPLIRLLGLADADEATRELSKARVKLVGVAIGTLEDNASAPADCLRQIYELERRAAVDCTDSDGLDELRSRGLKAIAAERNCLESVREKDEIGIGAYLQLQEEIDWRELTLLRDADRRIQES